MSRFSEWRARNIEHRRAYERAAYAADGEHRREYARYRRLQFPEMTLLKSARDRAKKLGIEFNIDLTDITIPVYCPVLGMRLEAGSKGRANSPSLDRINPHEGYVKGNVQVISNKANVMKSDATPAELHMFADWVYKTVVSPI